MDQEGQEQQPTSVSSEAGALTSSEKGTKKSSKVLIPVLIIIAFAGVVFGVYGILQECPSCIIECTDVVFESSKSNPTEPEEPTSQETPEQTENTYANFAKKLTENRNPLNIYGYYIGTTDTWWTTEARIDINGHLKIVDRKDNSSENEETIFEGDGYLSAYFVRTGNGGVPHFYLISDDGTVSRFCISEGERKIQKLEDYSNIVSVLNGADLYALLIDINGNVYRDAGV